MSIVYALSLLGDLCLYLAEIGLVSIVKQTSPFLLLSAGLLSFGAGLGFVLAKRGEKWRYIPLILTFIAFLFKPSVSRIILFAPMAVYSVMYVMKNHTATDHYYAFQRFRIGLIIMIFTLIISLLLGSTGVRDALLPVLLYLIVNITQLRMLRHDDRTIRQRKFQMMNLAGVAGVLLIGAILSIDSVVAAMVAALNFVYENVILRILGAVIWLLGWIIQILVKLISLLPFGNGMADFEMNDMLGLDGDQSLLEGMTSEEVASNPMLAMVFKGVGIALLCVVVFLILRALSRRVGHMTSSDQKEEREDLDDALSPDDRPGLFRRRRDPNLNVRYIYRQYLLKAQGRGVMLTGRQNSKQIRDLSQEHFDEDALDELRACYIRARYGGIAEKEDVQRAKDAYNRLKKAKSD